MIDANRDNQKGFEIVLCQACGASYVPKENINPADPHTSECCGVISYPRTRGRDKVPKEIRGVY